MPKLIGSGEFLLLLIWNKKVLIRWRRGHEYPISAPVQVLPVFLVRRYNGSLPFRNCPLWYLLFVPSRYNALGNAIGIQRSDAWSGEWEHYQKGLNRLFSRFRHDIYTIPCIDLSVLRQFPDFLQVRTLSHGVSFLQLFRHWRQNAYNQSELPRRFFISRVEIMSSSLSSRRSRAMR